jgi:hypothetical protein
MTALRHWVDAHADWSVIRDVHPLVWVGLFVLCCVGEYTRGRLRAQREGRR